MQVFSVILHEKEACFLGFLPLIFELKNVTMFVIIHTDEVLYEN